MVISTTLFILFGIMFVDLVDSLCLFFKDDERVANTFSHARHTVEQSRRMHRRITFIPFNKLNRFVVDRNKLSASERRIAREGNVARDHSSVAM